MTDIFCFEFFFINPNEAEGIKIQLKELTCSHLQKTFIIDWKFLILCTKTPHSKVLELSWQGLYVYTHIGLRVKMQKCQNAQLEAVRDLNIILDKGLLNNLVSNSLI